MRERVWPIGMRLTQDEPIAARPFQVRQDTNTTRRDSGKEERSYASQN